MAGCHRARTRFSIGTTRRVTRPGPRRHPPRRPPLDVRSDTPNPCAINRFDPFAHLSSARRCSLVVPGTACVYQRRPYCRGLCLPISLGVGSLTPQGGGLPESRCSAARYPDAVGLGDRVRDARPRGHLRPHAFGPHQPVRNRAPGGTPGGGLSRTKSARTPRGPPRAGAPGLTCHGQPWGGP